MIVVDTSVWIANMRKQAITAVQLLREPDVLNQILVGDIVMTEVLQGARNENDAARLEADLRQFPIVAMGGDVLAVKAARHYRTMRAAGFTMKIADLYIGTFCIQHGHALLQCDADFQPMARLCGLRLLS